MTNRAIEIHDSDLESLVVNSGNVVLTFAPAYIHQSAGNPGVDAGSGWTQHLVIRIHGEVTEGALNELPCTLWDGDLTLNGTQFDNTIPIPLSFEGDVRLHLTSVPGESVQVIGTSITLELLGEPKYIEDFPRS
jgi:hypothetical protein